MDTIQTILYDADGVLVVGDSFKNHLEHDLHITPSMTGEFFGGAFNDCLRGQADLKTAIAPYLSRWGWRSSPAAFLDLWFDIEKQTNQQLLDHVQQLRKQGLKCYVATNQERYRTSYMKEFMMLEKYFDGIFASNQLGVCKPDQVFFQTILSQLQITDPTTVMFWDDMQVNVDAALSMNIDAHLYTSFDDYRKNMQKSNLLQ